MQCQLKSPPQWLFEMSRSLGESCMTSQKRMRRGLYRLRRAHQLSGGIIFCSSQRSPLISNARSCQKSLASSFLPFFLRKTRPTKVQNSLKRITPGENALQSRQLLPSKTGSTSGYICHKYTWKTVRVDCLFLHFHHT